MGCCIQDPGTRGYRWWKTADFSHSAGTARAQRTVHPLRPSSSSEMCPKNTQAQWNKMGTCDMREPQGSNTQTGREWDAGSNEGAKGPGGGGTSFESRTTTV